MDEDALLEQLSATLASSSNTRRPPATRAALADFENRIGLRLPRFYSRLLTEVANGGFGPGVGAGIIGIPPDGYFGDDLQSTDLAEAYLRGRRCDELQWRIPRGFLYLCNWGCGTYSYVDALSTESAVVTDDALEDRLEFTETAAHLARWLADWLAGTDLEKAMYEIDGYREGMNPFTGKPCQFPSRRRIGCRIDVQARR